MLQFGINPVGLGSIMGYLSSFPSAVDSGGKAALIEIAPYVVEKAKQNLVDYPAYITGDLFRSVYWEETGTGIAIGARMYYAYFVEYGTSKMAAEPYLRPAIAEYLESKAGANQIMNKIQQEAKEGAITGAAVGALGGFGLLGFLTSFALIAGIAMAGVSMIMESSS